MGMRVNTLSGLAGGGLAIRVFCLSVRMDGTQRDNRRELRVAVGGDKAIMKGADDD